MILRRNMTTAIVIVIVGASLSFFATYFPTRAQLLVPGNGEQCGEPQFTNNGKNAQGYTESSWRSCITQQCGGGAGQVGRCANEPGRACQRFCMGDTTAEGKIINCCTQVVKSGGCTRVDGKCDGQLPDGKPEAGGQGEQKPGQGGEPPKLPELPKPQGGGGSGGGDQGNKAGETCEPGATATPSGKPCPTQSSGVGEYLSNLIPGASNAVEAVQSTLSSAAGSLSSLLGFGSDSNEETSATPQGSGGTTVTVPSGGAQLAPQVVQATPIASNSNGNAPSAVVTGFGGGGSSGAQSGIMTAISETLAGIGVTISNLLSSFAL